MISNMTTQWAILFAEAARFQHTHLHTHAFLQHSTQEPQTGKQSFIPSSKKCFRCWFNTTCPYSQKGHRMFSGSLSFKVCPIPPSCSWITAAGKQQGSTRPVIRLAPLLCLWALPSVAGNPGDAHHIPTSWQCTLLQEDHVNQNPCFLTAM